MQKQVVFIIIVRIEFKVFRCRCKLLRWPLSRARTRLRARAHALSVIILTLPELYLTSITLTELI